jgi:hypothetical protein
MTRSVRTAVALVAAYTAALQAILLGVVLTTHTELDSFAVVCVNGSSQDQNGPFSHQHDCDYCTLLCGCSSAGLVTSGSTVWLPAVGSCGNPVPYRAEALPSPLKHQPQASRAPPTDA